MGSVAGARLPTIGARGIAVRCRVSKPAVFRTETQGESKELSQDYVDRGSASRAVHRGLTAGPGARVPTRDQGPRTGDCACTNLALRTSQRYVLDRTRPA